MKKIISCPFCQEETTAIIKNQKEIFPVKGEAVEIDSEVVQCEKCNKDVFDEVLDSNNLEAAYNSYRKKHNLLSPFEITSVRNKYGLSQRSFSRLLNWGQITMNRYENGAIQDAAHDSVLRLLKNPENMKIVFDLNSSDLNASSRSALENRLKLLANEDILPKFKESFKRYINRGEANIFTGFKTFDLSKFENMILYFTDKLNGVFKTKINKLLWYADFLNFKIHTVSMSGVNYIHYKYGPVPKDYQLIIGNMELDESISIYEKILNEEKDIIGEEINALIEPDNSDFLKSEIEILDYVIQKFKYFGSKEITDYSHKEKAFKETREFDAISYEYAGDLSITLIE